MIQQPPPVRPCERVLGVSDNVAGVWFLLNEVAAWTDHIGSGNEWLETGEAGVVPAVAEGELLRRGHFWL